MTDSRYASLHRRASHFVTGLTTVGQLPLLNATATTIPLTATTTAQ